MDESITVFEALQALMTSFHMVTPSTEAFEVAEVGKSQHKLFCTQQEKQFCNNSDICNVLEPNKGKQNSGQPSPAKDCVPWLWYHGLQTLL